MTEVYTTSTSHSYISAKKIREMKKKALQSYKKISTIRQKSDSEKRASAVLADNELEDFIQKA